MSEYPEHEKLKGLGGQSQTVGDFIEWLGEHGYEICRFSANSEEYHPAHVRRDKMIADFFQIDEQKLEAEKRAMLEELRR